MTALFGGPLPHEYDQAGGEPGMRTAIDQILQVRDRRRISVRTADLLSLPMPLPSESISSWICRAALSQGIAVSHLLSYLGWPKGPDIDVEVADWFQDCSFAGDSFFSRLEHARQLLVALKGNGWSPSWVLLKADRTSRYRFCSRCLEADATPFFRQEWRFDAWRACWAHGCLMEDHCPHCGQAPTLPFSMLAAGKGAGVGLLDECRWCGKSLRAAKPVFIDDAIHAGLTSWGQALMKNGRTLIAALLCGDFQVEGYDRPGRRQELLELVRQGLLPTSFCPPSVKEFRERLQQLTCKPQQQQLHEKQKETI